MKNGEISDGQITASSQWDDNHASFHGRLDFAKWKAGSWSASRSDLHQWLQVDLGTENTKVTRVATQGRNDYDQWVAKYKLQYSNNGTNFQNYREQGQTVDKVTDLIFRDSYYASFHSKDFHLVASLFWL